MWRFQLVSATQPAEHEEANFDNIVSNSSGKNCGDRRQSLIRELERASLLDALCDDDRWQADELTRVGGQDAGPDSRERLLAAVGSCTVMTLRPVRQTQELSIGASEVDQVKVAPHHSRGYMADCEGCSEKERRLETIDRYHQ